MSIYKIVRRKPRIGRTVIIEQLESLGYGTRFTLKKEKSRKPEEGFSKTTEKVLLDGKEIQPKLLSMMFALDWGVEVSTDDFKDAIYLLANKNKELVETDGSIFSCLQEELTLNDNSQVRVRDLVFKLATLPEFSGTTPKSLEIRIAKLLSAWGFRKKKTRSGIVWLPDEPMSLDDYRLDPMQEDIDRALLNFNGSFTLYQLQELLVDSESVQEYLATHKERGLSMCLADRLKRLGYKKTKYKGVNVWSK